MPGRVGRGLRQEEGEEGSLVEEVELEEAEDLMEGEGQTIEELDVSNEEIDAQSDPELCKHGIAGGSEETFDFEMLLDPLEEEFDFPPGLVDVGDGLGRQGEVIGEEEVVLTGGGVAEADAAQGVGIFLVAVGELDDLVGSDALTGSDQATFLDGVPGPSLEARDHENTL